MRGKKGSIMYPYEDRMTQEMLDCLIPEDVLKFEILHCKCEYLKADDACMISLPATAASGMPVIHGTRNIMADVRSYWKNRAVLAFEALRLAIGTDATRAWLQTSDINIFLSGR